MCYVTDFTERKAMILAVGTEIVGRRFMSRVQSSIWGQYQPADVNQLETVLFNQLPTGSEQLKTQCSLTKYGHSHLQNDSAAI